MQWLQTQFHQRIGLKLGRCPSCMRAAARGTVAGWAAAAVLYLLWPGSLLLGVALVVAVGFTALLFAHLAAYMRRVVPRVLCDMRRSGPQTDQERRRFLRTTVRLGIGAVVLSLWGFGRAVLAVVDNCPDSYDPGVEIEAVDLNEARCKRKLVKIAEADVCDCPSRSCAGKCEAHGRKPRVEIVQVIDFVLFVECTGKVTACYCRCKKQRS